MMPFQAAAYRVLIASPSELAIERRAVAEVIHEWNDSHSAAENIVLLPLRWETHAMPKVGIRPQAALNRQLVQPSDLLIGMFWTKIGSNTGVAESGTVEEIDQFVAAGKPAMLYFCNRKIDPDKLDIRQYRRLKTFKAATYKTAVVATFKSTSALRTTLARNLMQQVRELKARQPIQESTREIARALDEARAQIEKLHGQLKGRQKDQTLADLLTAWYRSGVTDILNGPPRDESGIGDWRERAAQWTNGVLTTMRERGCTLQELNHVEIIGIFNLLPLHSNRTIAKDLSMFAVRLQRVADIATKYGK
ncbi:MAG: hypothetical protein ACREUZ_09595 [Burkholderiales bacterium]